MHIVYVVMGAFLLTACSGMKGNVQDGQYKSPAGNFTVPLPKSWGKTYLKDGYDEESGHGFIEVATDMGHLQRISYDHEEQEFWVNLRRVEAAGLLREFMRGYFEKEFVPKNYPPSSKASLMSGPVFLPSQHGEMLFAVMRLPQGSGALDLKTGKHYDGIRGVLLFFRDGFSYHLHNESTGLFNLEPSANDAKQSVLALYGKIEFRN